MILDYKTVYSSLEGFPSAKKLQTLQGAKINSPDKSGSNKFLL